jgi:hypothetical protein
MEKAELRYTDEAKKRLTALQNRYLNDIESSIRRRKYVPGEDLIEVTASDLEYASQRIIMVDPRERSWVLRYLFSYLYLAIGVALMVYGAFSDEFKRLLLENPRQALYMATGAAMVVVSLVMLYSMRAKEKFMPRRLV